MELGQLEGPPQLAEALVLGAVVGVQGQAGDVGLPASLDAVHAGAGLLHDVAGREDGGGGDVVALQAAGEDEGREGSQVLGEGAAVAVQGAAQGAGHPQRLALSVPQGPPDDRRVGDAALEHEAGYRLQRQRLRGRVVVGLQALPPQGHQLRLVAEADEQGRRVPGQRQRAVVGVQGGGGAGEAEQHGGEGREAGDAVEQPQQLGGALVVCGAGVAAQVQGPVGVPAQVRGPGGVVEGARGGQVGVPGLADLHAGQVGQRVDRGVAGRRGEVERAQPERAHDGHPRTAPTSHSTTSTKPLSMIHRYSATRAMRSRLMAAKRAIPIPRPPLIHASRL